MVAQRVSIALQASRSTAEISQTRNSTISAQKTYAKAISIVAVKTPASIGTRKKPMCSLLRTSVVTVFAIVFSSCGDSKTETSSRALTYFYEENGCPTGEHTSTSLRDYCENLLNDELNHFCAEELRIQAFRASCKSVSSAAPQAKATSANIANAVRVLNGTAYTYDFSNEKVSIGGSGVPLGSAIHKIVTDHLPNKVQCRQALDPILTQVQSPVGSLLQQAISGLVAPCF